MKLQNLLLVTLTSMALLSCNDSDDGIETPAAQDQKSRCYPQHKRKIQ